MPRRRFIDNRPTHPFPRARTRDTNTVRKALVATFSGDCFARRVDGQLQIFKTGDENAPSGDTPELVVSFDGPEFVSEIGDDGQLRIFRLSGDEPASSVIGDHLIPLTAAGKQRQAVVREKAQDTEHAKMLAKVIRQAGDFWQRAQGIRT